MTTTNSSPGCLLREFASLNSLTPHFTDIIAGRRAPCRGEKLETLHRHGHDACYNACSTLVNIPFIHPSTPVYFIPKTMSSSEAPEPTVESWNQPQVQKRSVSPERGSQKTKRPRKAPGTEELIEQERLKRQIESSYKESQRLDGLNDPARREHFAERYRDTSGIGVCFVVLIF